MGRRDEQREKEAQQLRTSRQQPPASRASISSVDIASMARRRPEGLDDLRDVRESMAHNWCVALLASWLFQPLVPTFFRSFW